MILALMVGWIKFFKHSMSEDAIATQIGKGLKKSPPNGELS
jgi:hypothetical protein